MDKEGVDGVPCSAMWEVGIEAKNILIVATQMVGDVMTRSDPDLSEEARVELVAATMQCISRTWVASDMREDMGELQDAVAEATKFLRDLTTQLRDLSSGPLVVKVIPE